MITLQPELFEALDTPAGLQDALQNAIRLEHATIPPYLYALYSIVPGRNVESAELVRSVVLEEMGHMVRACNVLNAIGGAPVIDEPGFLPSYPGPLPGAVEEGLTVTLAPFSPRQVEDVFMVIEEPEDPLEFPTALAPTARQTIGQFYGLIRAQIIAAGEAIFTGRPDRQVEHDLGSDESIAVTNVAKACAAIDLIVEQGEGTPTTPLDEEDELAHYYRFAEIVNGRRLVRVPNPPPDAPPDELYSYSGEAIGFDPAGVQPVPTSPQASSWAAGTPARRACDTFNYTYTSLLRALHDTVNGTPSLLGAAVGLMESCKLQAIELMAMQLDDGSHAAPTFEYQPTNP